MNEINYTYHMWLNDLTRALKNYTGGQFSKFDVKEAIRRLEQETADLRWKGVK